MRRYFVTGTDTDCGKTYVTCELLKYFPNSAAIKPIASGCEERNGELQNADAINLQRLSSLSLAQINPWRFKSPIAPHIAAAQKGQALFTSELVDYCLNLQIEGIENLFIEGAGGLMVPLNNQDTWVDFLIQSQIPVILVVGMKLGCINHALLTAQVLDFYKITCVGWIANCMDSQMCVLEENILTLKNTLKMPLLATIDYGQSLNSCQELLSCT